MKEFSGKIAESEKPESEVPDFVKRIKEGQRKAQEAYEKMTDEGKAKFDEREKRMLYKMGP